MTIPASHTIGMDKTQSHTDSVNAFSSHTSGMTIPVNHNRYDHCLSHTTSVITYILDLEFISYVIAKPLGFMLPEQKVSLMGFNAHISTKLGCNILDTISCCFKGSVWDNAWLSN